MERWTAGGPHRIVSLPCGHLFGNSCILKWLKSYNSSCPTCKKTARRGEVRRLYSKNISVLDNSEYESLKEELGAAKKELEVVKQREYMTHMSLKAKQVEIETLKKELLTLSAENEYV